MTMMLAYDTELCGECRNEEKAEVERWKYALERKGMVVSKTKTEYACVSEKDDGKTVKVQGMKVAKVDGFKDLGSAIQSNEGCDREVKETDQAGWNG